MQKISPEKDAEIPERASVMLDRLATDLETKRGETEADRRDEARRVGPPNSVGCTYETGHPGGDADRSAHNLGVESASERRVGAICCDVLFQRLQPRTVDQSWCAIRCSFRVCYQVLMW
jgi:hypothetical protein